MIVTRLTGGLGNQMFQYAAGLALAEHHRTVLKLDVSWFGNDPQFESHNRYALACFNVTEQFATREEIDRNAGIRLTTNERLLLKLAKLMRFQQYARLGTSPGNLHYASSFAFYPEFFRQPDNSYLHGNWQSEAFFAPIRELIRLHFTFRYPPTPQVAAVADRIRSAPSAAIHFRRGDYTRNPAFASEMGVLDLGYYRRAVSLIRERSPECKLYIFSDDIESVAREFTPPGAHEFVSCIKPWHSYDKIRLMSLCDHIAIANSTFSWWAAWLNSNPQKLVIAPQPWFAASSHDESTLVPKDWCRLPR